MNDEWYDAESEEQERLRRERRAKRVAMQRQMKQRQILLRRLLIRAVPLGILAIALIVFLIIGIRRFIINGKNDASAQTEQIEQTEVLPEEPVVAAGPESISENNVDTVLPVQSFTAQANEQTKELGEDVISTQALLVDMESNTILAQRSPNMRINPASMTKILTVLVAAEHVTNLDDTVTITLDITDYSYKNDCSAVGFSENEVVPVRDLFYGTILPSGADAALALATYVAGSQEAFVDMMNEKLVELGISDTAHFTNCVGIYDENHYCTAYDMAMILEAAVSNEFCKEVLSAHTYTTASTTQHPDGITISNWFLRRIEDKDSGGTVLCAKTGYVVQSGNCAASYAEDSSGNGYICVTVNATSGWRCIYDHVAIYKQFLPVAGS